MRAGVVTGLALEAVIVRAAWPQALVRAAPGPTAAVTAAEGLLADGAVWLLSFGTAGGLASDLGPGDLVVPTTVADTHGAWRLPAAADLAAELGARTGRLTSVDAPLLDAAQKAQAGRRGALAVDMESAAVVATAAANGCPALVVRAIADPRHRRLPRLAAHAIDGAGELRPWAVAAALLRYPGDWPAVAHTARDAAAARARLRGAALRLAALAGERLLERFLDVPVEDVDRRPLV